MAAQHKSSGRGGAPADEFAAIWEFLEGKTAAAGGGAYGGVVCISSLPSRAHFQPTAGLEASLDRPAIDPPSRHRSSLSQPHSTAQLHSLFTLFSYCKRGLPFLADQYYFSSQNTLSPAATATMPGPLRERDPNVHASRRSSVQFLSSLRPKSRLSHQRISEHELLSSDESEENNNPHFMTSTSASSSRSITSSTLQSAPSKPRRTPTPHALLTLGAFRSKPLAGEANDDVADSAQNTNGSRTASPNCAPLSPLQADSFKPALDKPLPGRPVAHVITTSPYKESRTLLDASEKPLRRSPGTPDEEDWPALFPTRPASPSTLQAFSRCHPAPLSPKQLPAPTQTPMESSVSRSPAPPGKQRSTIKMVAQSSENILPKSQQAENISTSQATSSSNRDHKPNATDFSSSPSKSSRLKDNAAGSSLSTNLPQPRARLVDIPSPKSRLGRRPPVTNTAGIPRARGIPRPSGPVQSNPTRQMFQQPLSDHPRGYPRMVTPCAPFPEPQSANNSVAPSLSPTNQIGNTQRKKSAIPLPARTTSPQTIPFGPAVFTLKAKVSTPSSLGGKSLSTIESVDTGNVDQEPDANTVMRAGPQRRPTLSKSGREFKHLSADTDTDPTTMSAQTDTSISRPSSRTDSSLWVETDNAEGTRTKRLSSSGTASDYGPTLTISPDADELIMGRKTSPSPPAPPVSPEPTRNSGNRARNLHRMAVTNEHRKASGQNGVSGGNHAKSRNAAPMETLRRQRSGDSIQAETFTVRSTGEQKHSSLASSGHLESESLRLLNASQIEANSPNDTARLAAVSQTLAMLEGGYQGATENPKLDGNTDLTKSRADKSRTSLSSHQSSIIFRNSQFPRNGSGNLVRSDSGQSISNKRVTSLSRDPGNPKRSSSVISVASSRPPVPAKDSRPTSRAPFKDPSIRKRNSSGRIGASGLRSPYGLSNGYSATPSNIPQPVNGRTSSGRVSSGRTMTETARSVPGDKRSISRAKLTMSGFRGLFHKKTDLKFAGKTGDKKKRTDMKVSSTGSPVLGSRKLSGCRSTNNSGRGSPGRLGTLTKLCHNHPAECLAASPPPDSAQVSEITQTTALAMHITTMAREEEDESKRHQLLSVATAMLGAIDSAKYAKIAAEQAAQAAREASMHQEMTRQSLIAINKVLGNSHGVLGTLTRSRTNIRQKTSRPSTIAQ